MEPRLHPGDTLLDSPGSRDVSIGRGDAGTGGSSTSASLKAGRHSHTQSDAALTSAALSAEVERVTSERDDALRGGLGVSACVISRASRHRAGDSVGICGGWLCEPVIGCASARRGSDQLAPCRSAIQRGAAFRVQSSFRVALVGGSWPKDVWWSERGQIRCVHVKI
jgi:hypothetical protein